MNNRAFSKIWIIIIFVIFVAGGILAWQYWWVPKEEEKTPEEISEDETADWKTYRNEEYGFKFQYPENWLREKVCSESICRGWRYKNLLDSESFFDISMYAISKPLDEFIKEDVEEYFHQEGIPPTMNDRSLSKRELTIEGIQAIERIVQYSNEPRTDLPFNWSGKTMIKIYIPLKENMVLEFDVPDNTRPIFNQILSTFRFLE